MMMREWSIFKQVAQVWEKYFGFVSGIGHLLGTDYHPFGKLFQWPSVNLRQCMTIKLL